MRCPCADLPDLTISDSETDRSCACLQAARTHNRASSTARRRGAVLDMPDHPTSNPTSLCTKVMSSRTEKGMKPFGWRGLKAFSLVHRGLKLAEHLGDGRPPAQFD